MTLREFIERAQALPGAALDAPIRLILNDEAWTIGIVRVFYDMGEVLIATRSPLREIVTPEEAKAMHVEPDDDWQARRKAHRRLLESS